jgi:cytochrome c oxidase subunit 2
MKTLRLPLLLALLAWALAACRAGVQSMAAPAAEQAAGIQSLWHLMLWVCVPIYLLVLAGLAFALRRRRAAVDAEATSGEARADAALRVWVVFIVLVLLGLALSSYALDRYLLQREAQPTLSLRVTGKQWWWAVEYQSDDPSQRFSTANELHVPAGARVRIALESPDVIHSLWIPRLSGKLDLVPGRHNVLWLAPRTPGRYRGQCAEFCGLQHAKMAIDVQVQAPADFERWRRAQLQPAAPPADPLAQRGLQLFESGPCAMCHAITGTSAASHAGPDLTHLASRRTLAAGALPMNRAALRAWIADPQDAKPGTNMPKVPLDKAQLDALVAYLETLK